MVTAAVDLERTVYLTELTGMRLEGPTGERIGRIREAAVIPREHPRRVARFLFGEGSTRFMLRYDQVESISLSGIRLADNRFVPYYPDEGHLLLVSDLLDKQIVDVNGRKVVRVNDVALKIHPTPLRDELWVHEVGVGLQGAFRRLTEGILPDPWIRRVQQKLKPSAIPWEFCNIVEPDSRRRLKLLISHDRLGQLHPADLADIVEDLGPAEREALFETLDEEIAAEALAEVDPKIQIRILKSLNPQRAAEIIEEMAPDMAADLLGELEEKQSEEILRDMEEEPAAEVGELLEYEEDTAGGLMTTEFVALNRRATVREAIEELRRHEGEIKSITHIFLADDEGRLIGAVPIGRLFLAAPEQPVAPLAFRETPKVDLEAEKDWVVEIFDKYNLYALPVVDENDVLCGVITADDVISLLRPPRPQR